jgi:hypothetical protein
MIDIALIITEINSEKYTRQNKNMPNVYFLLRQFLSFELEEKIPVLKNAES